MRTIKKVNTSYKHDENQIDFYATINEDMTPHITMITSLHIYDDDTLIWGEYSAGMSKRNQQDRNKVAFLSVIDNQKLVSGKAEWIHSKTSGEELDALNQIPEFRYNNVNGFSPAHILKSNGLTETVLDAATNDKAKADSKAVCTKIGKGNQPQAISTVTRECFAAEKGFKVMAYVGDDGYPAVIALPQALLTESNRIVFSAEAQEDELIQTMLGKFVSIYAIEYPSMCSVLVSGKLKKTTVEGKEFCYVDVDRVYNPMLPVAGYVYPHPEIKRVTEYTDTLHVYNV